MAETPTPDGSVEAAAEQLRGILNPEPPPEEESATAETAEEPVEEPEAAEPEEAEPEAEEVTETEVEEPEIPAILPPSSWSEADRAQWATLPPEVQETVARRERERDAAFTKRSQEHAQKIREAEEAASQVAAERQHYLDQLNPFIQGLQAELNGEDIEAQLDALLEAGDTYEYELKKRDIEKKQTRLARLQEEQNRITQEQQLEQQRTLARYKAEEDAKLIEALPAWANPEKAKVEKTALADYLKGNYGYTDEDLGMVYDHRYMVIAHKARLYDQLRRSKPEVAKKVKTAKPVVRPGTPATRDDREVANAQQKMSRLQKARDSHENLEAAADIFRDLL
jgi:hypothetical protein